VCAIGVNVLARQQIPEVAVSIAALVSAVFRGLGVLRLDLLLGQIAARPVGIAHGQHAKIRARQAAAEQAAALFANADEAQRNLFAGRSIGGEQAGTQKQRRGSGHGGGLQKITAREGTGRIIHDFEWQ
jgi:hypothetical protein